MEYSCFTILYYCIAKRINYTDQSVQFCGSVVSNSLQPHGLRHTRLPCPSLSPGSLLKLMSIESMMPSNHLILCRPLLLLPSVLPSIRIFSNELALHIGWPKYWGFSFSISPSNKYSGLISLRIAQFDLLAIQGTFKNPLLLLLLSCFSRVRLCATP